MNKFFNGYSWTESFNSLGNKRFSIGLDVPFGSFTEYRFCELIENKFRVVEYTGLQKVQSQISTQHLRRVMRILDINDIALTLKCNKFKLF